MSREQVDQLVEKLSAPHEDNETVYTCCQQNGCWDACCILKCQVKDGKLISVIPDDTVNRDDCREDIDEALIKQGMVQMRPCPMGHAWQEHMYGDTRVLYPMKRVGERGPGKGHFERISWEEALDTIAGKMQEIKDKYGT